MCFYIWEIIWIVHTICSRWNFPKKTTITWPISLHALITMGCRYSPKLFSSLCVILWFILRNSHTHKYILGFWHMTPNCWHFLNKENHKVVHCLVLIKWFWQRFTLKVHSQENHPYNERVGTLSLTPLTTRWGESLENKDGSSSMI